MKPRSGVSLALALLAPLAALRGQKPPPVTVVAADAAPHLTVAELDRLVGPIALYPDALVALILPAAAAPVDVVLAARYLRDGGDPAAASSRAWDEGVKSLAHYPGVIKWMDENMEWTKQLGEAFLRQPADVMKAIQRLREQARAAGTLASTPQQIVGYDSGIVTIVPAQPDVIYVPRYEPEYVYVRPAFSRPQPAIVFGTGFAVGAWLTHDCDWRAHRIWVVNRHWNWRERRDWRQPVFPGHPGYVADPHRQPWRPPPVASRPPSSRGWQHPDTRRPGASPTSTFVATTVNTAVPVATHATEPTAASSRRDRPPETRRPGNTIVNRAPAAAVVGPEPSPSVPATPWRRPPATEPERRSRSQPAQSRAPEIATAPVRSFPFNTAPATPVVAPITSPIVAPITAVAPSPRPQISMASAPPTAAQSRPRISMSSISAAPQDAPQATPSPARTRGNPPAPAQPPASTSAPPPQREERDHPNSRRRVNP